jgi:hypothetical protein
MTWWNCVDKSMNFKQQFINSKLSSQLLTYMEDKDSDFALDFERSEYEESIYFELGGYGAMFYNQPKMNFDLFGNTLRLDCVAIDNWIKAIKESKRRNFADGVGYHKFYSRFNCLILSVPEKESLLFQMSGKQEDARKQSEGFFTGMKRAWDKKDDDPYKGGKAIPSIDVKNLDFAIFPTKEDDEPDKE